MNREDCDCFSRFSYASRNDMIVTREKIKYVERIKLPDELWIEILLKVDDTCLVQCFNVCHQWRAFLLSSPFWIRKCAQTNCEIPPIHAKYFVDYRKIYFQKPYGRNLIKNPSGEEGLRHWDFVGCTTGFTVERPPPGFEEEESFPLCFATSSAVCVKQQLIDLGKEGCDAVIIDHLQPSISVSEWHAARPDTASTHELHVLLLRSPPKHIIEVCTCSNHPNNLSEPHPFVKYLSNNIVAEFYKTTTVADGVGQIWRQTHHTFRNYGPGVRFVLFQSYGNDRQNLDGHCGAKMAKAYLCLSFAS